jgi:uncharacterized protein YdaU (DUF1376 family)
MPAKWQQWMPFKIDAFRSSPAVQAMHPAARAGYLYLLASAWQTDDCTLPSDALELAEISGLGDELWQIHGPRILRKFSPNGRPDRLQNPVLVEEWKAAKAVYDAGAARRAELSQKRSEAGKSGNEIRWYRKNATLRPNGVANASQVDRNGIANDRYTVTGTETVTRTPKKPAASRPEIEAIYQAYPKKKEKLDALKAILRAISVSGKSPAWMLERTVAYALERKNEDPQFTPYPASWFNKGGYLDEPALKPITAPSLVPIDPETGEIYNPRKIQ